MGLSDTWSSSAAQKAEQFKEEVWNSTKDFQDLVQKNKVMMFSATHCPYCKTAKVVNNEKILFFTLNVISESI